MKAKKINILLVDDNEKFLKSIAERTKLKGFNVFTASNGQQALDIVQKRHIHVAVVDQKMPDMEGLVVIAKLKELSLSVSGRITANSSPPYRAARSDSRM